MKTGVKGLVIWAQSNCRSTMGLYEEIYRQLGLPVVIALWFYHENLDGSDNRSEIGLRGDEFAHVPTVNIGEDFDRGMKLLDEHRGYDHLFTVFQNSPAWRALIRESYRRGERVAVACESPCNMCSGWQYIAKELYLRYLLPVKARSVIKAADSFINYSGNDDKYARLIGWPLSKIKPFGYFPPPLQGSSFVVRTTNKPFRILATGVLSKYRGADVIVDALAILKQVGIEFEATITQEGELLEKLRHKCSKYCLPVVFPGRVAMPELIRLYQSCSVYVGAGRSEPWGMRLNDALNCGAPLVVSRGMGGVKMVDDYGCGLAFCNGDAADLADKLIRLATDKKTYCVVARNVAVAARECSPRNMATKMISLLDMAGHI